jgi:hypothetical protein
MIRILALTIVLLTLAPISAAFAGSCDHASDRAADGSRCGNRAADQRSGGK